MRVPDQIRDCVVFVGLPGHSDPDYRGTAFLVTVPGTQQNDFAFMVTARHVAEHLQGSNFSIRVNKKDGTAVALQGFHDNPWWYHPTERENVDAAVTLFAPSRLPELAVEHIPIGMFADDQTIRDKYLGIGDDVFITGLFTKITETSKNIPIIRTGTVAMMPGERIPFGDKLIDAYLIESRSIGGLSGSPVFIRETLAMPVGQGQILPRTSNVPGRTRDFPQKKPVLTQLQGIGRFYFFGSVIGHWEVTPGLTPSQAEAVNMGIAPIVPAQKIKEIVLQPDLVEMMKNIDAEMRANNQTGATLDVAPPTKGTNSKIIDANRSRGHSEEGEPQSSRVSAKWCREGRHPRSPGVLGHEDQPLWEPFSRMRHRRQNGGIKDFVHLARFPPGVESVAHFCATTVGDYFFPRFTLAHLAR